MATTRRSTLLLPAFVAALVFLTLTGLGVWQLERLAEKQTLLDRIESALAASPVPAPLETEWSNLLPAAYDYRRVSVSGHYRHDREARVFGFIPAGETGETTPGYFILTPLETSGGATVIVNRGFVPQELGDRSRRPDGLVSGEVTITGLMRAPQPRGLFTPADDPRKGIWFTRDPVTIAADLDLRRVAPFTIDADASPVPGRWPEGGHTVVSVPNNHLQYALTWFALALALLAVFVTFARGRIKPAQREDAS